MTIGSITEVPGAYRFSEDVHLSGPFCPTAAGVVQEVGHFQGTRTLTARGRTTTEGFFVLFTITGRVDRSAKLTGYDVQVSVLSTDAAGHAVRMRGSAGKLKPGSSLTSIAPSQVTLLRNRRLAGDGELVTSAINYARDEGLVYLQNAETVFNKEASCLRIDASPAQVKRGTESAIAIRVFSRITHKQVDADLTLRPSGGAEAKPATTRTTPDHPAIVDIKMPAAPRGSSGDRRAIAAAAPSVAITGLSQQGRAVGTIGSQAGPVALIFDSTIVNAAPPADSQESGSITYHVHAVVPLAAGSPSAGRGPIAPASAPLGWVSVSGQHNKAGLIACSPVDRPYSLVETAAALNNGTFRLTRSSSAGDGGPTGLTLRIQMSPTPMDQLHSVFQGTCDGLWAPFDRTSTGSSWYHEFLENHLAAVAAGDPCNTTPNGPSCSFDITGWKPGATGVYATWQYSRVGFIGCPLPGYTCFGSSSKETTTIELR